MFCYPCPLYLGVVLFVWCLSESYLLHRRSSSRAFFLPLDISLLSFMVGCFERALSSRSPRFATKKSRISGIFGNPFISRIAGKLNYTRNPEIRTNLEIRIPEKISPRNFPRKNVPRDFFPIFFSGKSFSGQSFCFQKALRVEICLKPLSCFEFPDLLHRNQGFREYL